MEPVLVKCSNCKKQFECRQKNAKCKYCSAKCRAEGNRFVLSAGMKFNRLTILKEAPGIILKSRTTKHDIKCRMVECLCECGNIITTRLIMVRNGDAKSCGSLRVEKSEINIVIPTHRLSRHPIYTVWINMNRRCYSKKDSAFNNYGGRGVKVCDEWRNDFIEFYNWAIKNGWEKGLQLDKDKIGNGLLYSPKTCCFLSSKENNKFKRKK